MCSSFMSEKERQLVHSEPIKEEMKDNWSLNKEKVDQPPESWMTKVQNKTEAGASFSLLETSQWEQWVHHIILCSQYIPTVTFSSLICRNVYVSRATYWMMHLTLKSIINVCKFDPTEAILEKWLHIYL